MEGIHCSRVTTCNISIQTVAHSKWLRRADLLCRESKHGGLRFPRGHRLYAGCGLDCSHQGTITHSQSPLNRQRGIEIRSKELGSLADGQGTFSQVFPANRAVKALHYGSRLVIGAGDYLEAHVEGQVTEGIGTDDKQLRPSWNLFRR